MPATVAGDASPPAAALSMPRRLLYQRFPGCRERVECPRLRDVPANAAGICWHRAAARCAGTLPCPTVTLAVCAAAHIFAHQAPPHRCVSAHGPSAVFPGCSVPRAATFALTAPRRH
ncbi:hypothetical protein GGX14DRAFT_572549 [Mycena pura]|uniref:Uncharacterized protein n=1 Tax=Mycena pura TaxID=153505 RepID=A0AAD6Y3R8_9AGAR|nr:hypothetical protein GGX14DRAFT_572549 [Mycena pura]